MFIWVKVLKISTRWLVYSESTRNEYIRKTSYNLIISCANAWRETDSIRRNRWISYFSRSLKLDWVKFRQKKLGIFSRLGRTITTVLSVIIWPCKSVFKSVKFNKTRTKNHALSTRQSMWKLRLLIAPWITRIWCNCSRSLTSGSEIKLLFSFSEKVLPWRGNRGCQNLSLTKLFKHASEVFN